MNQYKLTYGGLFEGIGAFAKAAQEVGFKPNWSVDIDSYCCEKLKNKFTHQILNADVKDCGKNKRFNLNSVDVICGGFPCQNISNAGRGEGIRGEKSSLWKEMFRICKEGNPKYIIAENSDKITSRGLEIVLHDLSKIGYDAEWDTISSAYIGADHDRKRTYIIAYPSVSRREVLVCDFFRIYAEEEKRKKATSLDAQSNPFLRYEKSVGRLPVQSVDDGLPNRLVGLGAVGNSIYYPFALMLMKSIREHSML